MARTAVKGKIKSRINRHLGRTGGKDIFQLLKDEHDRVRWLFKRLFERERESEKTFTLIYSELEAHLKGEEQLVYPELEGEERVRGKVLEAYEEHNLAKILLNELEGMSRTDERWTAKLEVLNKVIEGHIREEEREIFPEAERMLGKEHAAELARQYLRIRPSLEERPEIGGVLEEEEF